MNTITDLDDRSFEAAITGDGPVLVDFYAPWCGPCKMLAPVLEALAAEFDGRVRFAKVNVDDSPRLAMRHGITGVPTLILFKQGRILETMVGMPSSRSLKARLEAVALPAAPSGVTPAG